MSQKLITKNHKNNEIKSLFFEKHQVPYYYQLLINYGIEHLGLTREDFVKPNILPGWMLEYIISGKPIFLPTDACNHIMDIIIRIECDEARRTR